MAATLHASNKHTDKQTDKTSTCRAADERGSRPGRDMGGRKTRHESKEDMARTLPECDSAVEGHRGACAWAHRGREPRQYCNNTMTLSAVSLQRTRTPQRPVNRTTSTEEDRQWYGEQQSRRGRSGSPPAMRPDWPAPARRVPGPSCRHVWPPPAPMAGRGCAGEHTHASIKSLPFSGSWACRPTTPAWTRGRPIREAAHGTSDGPLGVGFGLGPRTAMP